MLESLHDQDEVHIKAQKAENDRLQNVEKQLKTAQAKLDAQIEPLAKLPGLEVCLDCLLSLVPNGNIAIDNFGLSE